MKKTTLIILLIFITDIIFANQGEFLNSLSDKKYATFEDCIISFCYLYEMEVKKEYKDNIELLKQKIKYFPKKYNSKKLLTVGDFSLFAAQYLDLKSGMFYLAGKNGRYASRELMIIKIIPLYTSEHEKISGLNLIRLLQKVDDYASKKNIQ
ncbi:MAG: hypothetical protein JXB50_00395 [Spirochaetes bacterium]|nr:hypothetical protein [Spirochaetota bacterium]